MDLTIIAAVDLAMGIGINGRLPWNNQKEMRHFMAVTKDSSVIMGRSTYESIGHPLAGRENIVLSRNGFSHKRGSVYVASSMDSAVDIARSIGKKTFIIGGAKIYEQFMPLCNKMIVSVMDGVYNCDSFFPPISKQEWVGMAIDVTNKPNGFCVMFYERVQK